MIPDCWLWIVSKVPKRISTALSVLWFGLPDAEGEPAQKQGLGADAKAADKVAESPVSERVPVLAAAEGRDARADLHARKGAADSRARELAALKADCDAVIGNLMA